MGELSTKKRKDLPKSAFGLPTKVGKEGENEAGKGAYPMPDKSHAINAKARAAQMVDAGKLSESAKTKIDAKANKIIDKDKPKKDRKESMERFVERREKADEAKRR